MKIRDLNNDGTSLKVFADDQGDVYVTITDDNVSSDHTVRIGGPGSGHEIPLRISQLLHELAGEFDRFKGVQYENQAAGMDRHESGIAWLKSQIVATESMLRHCDDDLIVKTSLTNRLTDLKEQLQSLL